jgi:hypothetical protein
MLSFKFMNNIGVPRFLSFAVALIFLFSLNPAPIISAHELVPIERWQWRSAQLVSAAGDPLLLVGSIQKPFVVKAWSMAHSNAAPPIITCSVTSECWRVNGHGQMNLLDALSNSCNTYFLGLARQTPIEDLNKIFVEAGFQGRVLSAESAIGLDPLGPKIRPSSLFKAYSQLIAMPWEREDVRQLVIHGLRQAASKGTAKVGRPGYFAKTGTVQGASPNTTIGLAIAIDSSGNCVIARRTGATGREAAAQLFSEVSRQDDMVRVRLFELLGSQTVEVKNLEDFAITCTGGFLGANAIKILKPGDEVGPGLLEARMRQTNLRRVFHGRMRMDPKGGLIAAMDEREYVSGVINAELTQGHPRQLRIELGAAVIRYLTQRPRHGDADVCDNTHCAWFIGRGPRADWPTPGTAKEASRVLNLIDDEIWREISIRAKSPGPSLWTSHCGGKPLSPLAIWGSSSAEVVACPRHTQPTRHWERAWDMGKLEKQIGEQIVSAQIVWPKGQWTLRLQTLSCDRDFNYDAAHRLLAPIAGWNALPSPADSVWLTDNKIHANGRGLGHRVGLCLGD